MLSAAAQSKESPTLHPTCAAVGQRQSVPQHDVRTSVHQITSDELERHVASCGYLMLEAYKRYEELSCLGALGEAHRWKLLMQEGIKSRSAAQVARLEQERGLA